VRILVTRPPPDAKRTAAALRARGHEPILAPLFNIETIPEADWGAGPWTAVLVTSANAVRAIAGHARLAELEGIAAYTVGARTAGAMREAGFANVTSANGDVNDLAKLVAIQIEPPGRLLYLAGEERSGDLAGMLRAKGFAVHTVLVYRAAVVESLPAEAVAALAAGLDGVLHFSRRSAEAYVNAARCAGLADQSLREPVQFCLSARVAEPLQRAGAAKIRIAARPDEAAFLDLCG